ncbi:MAG: hypothetical protein JRC90_08420 [Deltaproteobacteria bacterium]|nr:hypothetical protein [Deltaproteobacteria bacterium]
MVYRIKKVNHLFADEQRFLKTLCPSYNHYELKRKCLRYHYTDFKAVKSILKNKNVRLMHYMHLNDSKEGKLLFEEIIKQLVDLGELELRDSFENLHKEAVKNLYLSSLSFFGNLLSQWRGYGYINIGFDIECLKNNVTMIRDSKGETHITSGFEIGSECNYIDFTKEDENILVNNIINKFKVSSIPSLEDMGTFWHDALALGAVLFSTKHIGFWEEREHRIVHYLWGREPFIDNTKDGKKFYIEFDFCAEAVKRIVVGPSKDQKGLIKNVRNFLKEMGSTYEHVQIYQSTIPFIDRRNFGKNF